MKILCISDQIDPLVYTNSIKTRFKDIDIILSAGDLPTDYHEFIVSSLNKPLFFVFGNHNLEYYHFHHRGIEPSFTDENWNRMASGAVHLGSKIKWEKGLIIAGLGGSMQYNKGDNQFSDFAMYLECFKLIPVMLFNRIFHGRYLDILLTHAPPRGIHDKADKCHRGFKAFLWFMHVFKPRYLVHGHIHLYDLADIRVTRYEDTLVVNAYSHFIIEDNNE
jgi:Icc-related predicted phosphoesterase